MARGKGFSFSGQWEGVVTGKTIKVLHKGFDGVVTCPSSLAVLSPWPDYKNIELRAVRQIGHY
jgi:hypothetical protein